MKRFLQIVGGLFTLLVIIYILGPRSQLAPVQYANVPVATDLIALEQSIADTEKLAGFKT